MKKLIAVLAIALTVLLAGCTKQDADRVDKNLTKSADNFGVYRQVVFYNAILDKYLLVVEGFCSVDPGDENRMTVTCKVGTQYKRDAMGKSYGVMWWYNQLEPSSVSPNHYKVYFKPSAILPDFTVR